MEWARENPHSAVALLVSVLAVMAALGKFVFSRHREYVEFVTHMRREEDEVWPTIQEQIAKNHEEAMGRFDALGQRVSKVEGKMPNGAFDTILARLDAMLKRLPEK